jgi:hypothetical protein
MAKTAITDQGSHINHLCSRGTLKNKKQILDRKANVP